MNTVDVEETESETGDAATSPIRTLKPKARGRVLLALMIAVPLVIGGGACADHGITGDRSQSESAAGSNATGTGVYSLNAEERIDAGIDLMLSGDLRELFCREIATIGVAAEKDAARTGYLATNPANDPDFDTVVWPKLLDQAAC